MILGSVWFRLCLVRWKTIGVSYRWIVLWIPEHEFGVSGGCMLGIGYIDDVLCGLDSY